MISLSEFAIFSSELLVLRHWIKLKPSLEVKKEVEDRVQSAAHSLRQSLALKALPAALTISLSLRLWK